MATLREKLRKKVWWSPRGWCNVLVLGFIVLALLSLFIIYPIAQNMLKKGPPKKNPNHVYQPLHPKNLPIDSDTPAEALTKTTFDGKEYTLVFSDEFNKDGRTFKAGEDPHWEAVDLWYWPTMDMEYYKPEQVWTEGGNLVLQMDKKPTGTLDYRSGMIQSWNKFCFQGGLIEVNVSMPFKSGVSGLWPAAWTLGNLGRAGYGATTDGLWPYTYDNCDLGVLVNQTNSALSYLPGQRLNKCVCTGTDHPNPGKGRGAPEIDIFEATGGYSGAPGSISQSFQVAPFDFRYEAAFDYAKLHNGNLTKINTYVGGPYQQALSGVTDLDPGWYGGKGYQTYGFQYTPGTQGDVNWFVGDQPTWGIDYNVVGSNQFSGIGQRSIAEEPMYIILNLGMASGFSPVELDKLEFPAAMLVDYVRVYQDPNNIAVSCDTPDFPTAEYINNHPVAYYNNNVTRWHQAEYTAPDYSIDGKC
ncbi:hypothetical protein H4R33_006254 [Dimargaris cristalligena]|uniref:Family 16 glycoside hydrolase n=1 Tax=Dimargaris cristalligena TaxID=215637 RepID=A0A4P9ZRM0_9FUNG|nr:hypothetical protein H4R33_006254 [Dimargaris cristalligena]RKP35401.1 family 16 glycoside hydrolase [Dimargaris cristalligena]|eukprot:RKP35401.1 family 16 glycoside hydrolase [Dimargaris cristalligena]